MITSFKYWLLIVVSTSFLAPTNAGFKKRFLDFSKSFYQRKKSDNEFRSSNNAVYEEREGSGLDEKINTCDSESFHQANNNENIMETCSSCEPEGVPRFIPKKKNRPTFDPDAAACFLQFKGKPEILKCPPLVNDYYFIRQWYLVPHPKHWGTRRKSTSSQHWQCGLFGGFSSCSSDYQEDNVQHTVDMGVVDVWIENQVFGEGVVVVDVDNGLQSDHPDLKTNYDSRFYWDFIEDIDQSEYAHGTKASGIIAMEMNNKWCGVGIAPLVTLGFAHAITNKSYSVAFHNQIYDSSNGMRDIHIIVIGFVSNRRKGRKPKLEKNFVDSFKSSSITGRNQKGTIHVIGAGNYKAIGFYCGFDSYSNNIFTITVAAVTKWGEAMSYSSQCAAIMIAAPSDGIVSVINGNQCTEDFGGTSASAPIAAGVIALALEANPNLTWRDIQHLLTITSTRPDQMQSTFQKNGAGFYVSHDIGFGVINAKNLVMKAYDFVSVPPLKKCTVPVPLNINTFGGSKFFHVAFETSGCKGTETEVNYIEHIQLYIRMTYKQWNNIFMDLISPHQTRAALLQRERSNNHTGYLEWYFDSVITWGESPDGIWKFFIQDNYSIENNDDYGTVHELKLILYGTQEKPAHYPL